MQTVWMRIRDSGWNSDERRLRALIRLVIHYAMWVLFALVLRILSLPAVHWFTAQRTAISEIGPQGAVFFTQLLAVLISTWLAVRFLDQRAFSQLGLQIDRNWWFDLIFGLALGAVLMTLIFAVESGLQWVTVSDTMVVGSNTSVPFWLAILGPAFAFICVGISEEILTRGYQMRNMAEGFNFGRRHAVVALLASYLVSSFVFGMLHVRNPNSTWISTIYLMMAGLFLGLGLVLTGRLGLPIGLHISWNFFQGTVYGFPVSGNEFSSTAFIAIEQAGPVRWTGGAFGPEAGLIGIFAIVLGCGLILLWVRMRYGDVALCQPYTVYTPRRGHGVNEAAVAGVGETS